MTTRLSVLLLAAVLVAVAVACTSDDGNEAYLQGVSDGEELDFDRGFREGLEEGFNQGWFQGLQTEFECSQATSDNINCLIIECGLFKRGPYHVPGGENTPRDCIRQAEN